jgi:ABC-type transporter Mla subunit MlaD
MSSGAALSLVAVVLAVLIAGLFRLRTVLDSAELTLRRLAADVRAARRAVTTAGDLAATLEADAARGQAALDRLEALKRPVAPEPGGAGPVSLPRRPGSSG